MNEAKKSLLEKLSDRINARIEAKKQKDQEVKEPSEFTQGLSLIVTGVSKSLSPVKERIVKVGDISPNLVIRTVKDTSVNAWDKVSGAFKKGVEEAKTEQLANALNNIKPEEAELIISILQSKVSSEN